MNNCSVGCKCHKINGECVNSKKDVLNKVYNKPTIIPSYSNPTTFNSYSNSVYSKASSTTKWSSESHLPFKKRKNNFN